MAEGKVVWTSGMQFVGEAGSGHAIVLDTSPENGGRNTGLRPMELVLVGLAGCTAVDIVSILRKKRQVLVGLEVRTTGVNAPEPPQIYTDIEIEYIVRGKGISRLAVEQAIQLSEEKYCSVGAMLKCASNITWRYRIEEV
jgi:putative redox protein